MIKFDKDVLRTLKTLEKEGFETYAAGECVRGQIMGEKVYDWDLLTKATLADLQRIFPGAPWPPSPLTLLAPQGTII